MNINDDRIVALSRKIADSLVIAGVVKEEKEAVFKETRKGFGLFVQKNAEIDEKVRKKIDSLQRNVPEGSDEWNILYRQYHNEEINKI